MSDSPPAISVDTFLDSSPDVILMLDGTGRIEIANRAAQGAFGLSLAEMSGVALTNLVDVPSRPKADRLLRTLTLGEPVTDYELNHAIADGEVVGMTYSGFRCVESKELGGDSPYFYVLVGRPLTTSLEIMADVVASNERLRAILAVMSAGAEAGSEREIAVSTAHVLCEHLPLYSVAIFRAGDNQTLTRIAPTEAPLSHIAQFDLLVNRGPAYQAVSEGIVVNGSCARVLHPSDSISRVDALRQWTALPLNAHDRTLGVLAVAARNIRGFELEDREMLAIVAGHLALAFENARLFQDARYLAQTDPLTEVSNRRVFETRLAEEIEKATDDGHLVGLLLLDIDHFKSVNDLYGHDAGDAALQGVAGVLRRAVRPTDTVARLGGEEFAIVVPNIGADVLAVIGERIRRAVEVEMIHADAHKFGVTVSLGGAIFPENADDREGLFRIADAALYESKRTGRNRVTLTPTVPEASTETQDIRSA